MFITTGPGSFLSTYAYSPQSHTQSPYPSIPTPSLFKICFKIAFFHFGIISFIFDNDEPIRNFIKLNNYFLPSNYAISLLNYNLF